MKTLLSSLNRSLLRQQPGALSPVAMVKAWPKSSCTRSGCRLSSKGVLDACGSLADYARSGTLNQGSCFSFFGHDKPG